jgi:hypothetical protein
LIQENSLFNIIKGVDLDIDLALNEFIAGSSTSTSKSSNSNSRSRSRSREEMLVKVDLERLDKKGISFELVEQMEKEESRRKED